MYMNVDVAENQANLPCFPSSVTMSTLNLVDVDTVYSQLGCIKFFDVPYTLGSQYVHLFFFVQLNEALSGFSFNLVHLISYLLRFLKTHFCDVFLLSLYIKRYFQSSKLPRIVSFSHVFNLAQYVHSQTIFVDMACF